MQVASKYGLPVAGLLGLLSNNGRRREQGEPHKFRHARPFNIAFTITFALAAFAHF